LIRLVELPEMTVPPAVMWYLMTMASFIGIVRLKTPIWPWTSVPP
jgi:hypothetical protein